MNKIIFFVFIMMPNLAAAQSINSCDDFVNHWLQKFEYAKKYRDYACESTKINSAKFVIFGKPGTKSTDQWFYQPKTRTVLRLEPENQFGKTKSQKVYRLKDFTVVSESNSQGELAIPIGAAAQRASKHDPKGDYCVISNGFLMECGLSLTDCQHVVYGLPGLVCIHE